MELFEQIRREYEHGVGTIKGVARKLGIHRRMVREALGDAVPRERKINTRGKPRIEPVKAFIEAILQGDENAPRKQRHTAHRIWSRIRKELPEVEVAESSIRRYVRERKIELKLALNGSSLLARCRRAALRAGVTRYWEMVLRPRWR